MASKPTLPGAGAGTPLSAAAEAAQALSPVLSDLESRSQSLGHALTSTFASALTGSKTLDEALRGLAQRLSGIALSAGLKPLETLAGNALSGLMKGLLPAAAQAPVAGVTAFADGGVVAAPSYFPMASGLGLMGEAGAEAILPLKRGADGALGVAMPGGGSGPSITFNVTTPDVQGFRQSEAQIAAMLARTVRRGGRTF